MRPSFLILSSLALCAATACAAANEWNQDRGPGMTGVRDGDTTVYPAQGFDEVAFGGAATADVRVGPSWSVRATGPAEALAEMRVRVEGDKLIIDNRQPYREGRSELQRQVHFAITLPRLDEVALGGSGKMTVDQVDGARLGVAVGGSGSLSIGRLAVDSAAVSIGGSGSVTTTGTARALTVNIGGSGSFDAPGLRAQGATISTAGSGSVRTSVDGHATVSTVGSGRIDLGTGAHCQISRMGRSEVRCGA